MQDESLTGNLMPEKKDSGTVQSVLKCLSALDYLIEQSFDRPGAGLTEIATALDLRPTNVRNLLKTMEQAGYVSRPDGRLYAPGPHCRGMIRAAACRTLRELLEPEIARLAEETGESTVLATMINGRRRVLCRCQGSSEVVVALPALDEPDDAWSLVTTRVMLAYLPEEELLQHVTQHGFPGADWDNITDWKALHAALDRIRAAEEAEDFPRDTYAVAYPLLDAEGRLLGALGIHLPRYRARAEFKRKLHQRVAGIRALAARI